MEQDKENKIRPNEVYIAVKLLYVALVIGVIRGMIGILIVAQAEPLIGVIIGGLITFVIIAFFTWLIIMIGKGRNWDRITYLILFIIGAPLLVFFYDTIITSNSSYGTVFGANNWTCFPVSEAII